MKTIFQKTVPYPKTFAPVRSTCVLKTKSKSLVFYFYLLFCIVLSTNTSKANNLQITGIAVNQTTKNITFTLSWDNSWRVATPPNNWDAVWIFVKWKCCSEGPAVAFTHGVLNSTTASHSYTNMEAMTTVNGTITQSAAQGETLDYTTGIMLRRNSVGLGTTTSSVSLNIPGLPDVGIDITTNVYGIEMVYVPQGDFWVGDGDGTATTCCTGGSYYKFLNAAAFAGAPMKITSAFETETSTFYTADGPTTYDPVPAEWPKGQYGFYIMKHEITQGLYAEFLNSLGVVAAGLRYPGYFGTNRNQLNVEAGVYSTTKPDRAQNFLGWADVSALLDWASLRPMTETEFEKACRGIGGVSITNEYAWGNTNIDVGLTFAAPALENGTEVTIAGNAVYSNAGFTNGDGGSGPSRAGIFATATSTRQEAGASYYGVLDLTGNLREVVVGMITPAASNTFTRTWGDGTVDITTGNHNVAGGWPIATFVSANNSTTNVVGHKGGAWNNAIAQLTVSERWYIYRLPVISRQNYNGGRGVR